MSNNLLEKNNNEVHVAKMAGKSNGLFNTAMNDKKFMKKVSNVLLQQHNKQNMLSQMLKKK